MTEKSFVKIFLSKYEKSLRYSDNKAYFTMFALSSLFSLLVILFPIEDFLKDSLYINIFAFSISLIALLAILLYFIEIRKAVSIKLIIDLIYEFMEPDFKRNFTKWTRHIVDLHPTVIIHPVSIFLYGNLFKTKGLKEEGIYLIDRAVDQDPNLKGIIFSERLGESDAEYLINSVKSNKALNFNRMVSKLWMIKRIRFLFIFLILAIFIFKSLCAMI